MLMMSNTQSASVQDKDLSVFPAEMIGLSFTVSYCLSCGSQLIVLVGVKTPVLGRGRDGCIENSWTRPHLKGLLSITPDDKDHSSSFSFKL